MAGDREDNEPTRRIDDAAAPPGGADPGAWPQVPHYRLLEAVGSGGMGTVFRAEQLAPVRREVALKVLAVAGSDVRRLAWFELESRLLARMQHPAIAQVHDAGTTADGRPYFAMEFIRGLPVTRYADEAGLGLEQRIRLFIHVCEGVQHAHQKGVIHRDLKPANILVAEVDGRPLPKVIDFGIATGSARSAEEEAADRAGTPAYMSPEQAGELQAEVDTRSDVYSLGIILFELLVGQRPTDATSDTGRALRTASTTLQPPSAQVAGMAREAVGELARQRRTSVGRLRRSLSSELDWIVLRAIARERDQRYASVAELIDDLRRVLAHRPVSAVPATRRYLVGRFIRRNRVAVAAASTMAAVLLAGFAVSLYGLQQAREQRALAQTRSSELEQVVAFQRAMLSDLDIQRMGAGLQARQDALLEAAGADPALRRDLAQRMLGGEGVAVSGALIDEYVLVPAHQGILRDLDTQPRVAAELLEALALYRRGIGREGGAIEVLEQALERLPADGDPGHRVRLLGAMGDSLRASGRLDEAEVAMARAGEILAGWPDAGLRDRVRLELARATLLGDQGRLTEAHDIQQRLLAQVPGPLEGERYAGETLGKIQNNLAISLMRLGRPQEAVELLLPVVRAQAEGLPEDHPDRLSTVGSLGVAHAMSGRFQEALELQQRTARIQRERLGPEHPGTLAEFNNVGAMMVELRRFDEAGEVLEEVHAARRRVLGEDHPQTLRTAINLGSLLSQSGDHARARELLSHVLERRRVLLGPAHPDTLSALSQAAAAAERAGDLDDARQLAREAVERRLEVLPEGHRDRVGATVVLARLEWAAGDPLEVLALTERAYADARALPPTYQPLAELALLRRQALLARGRDRDAEVLYDREVRPWLEGDWEEGSAESRFATHLRGLLEADVAAD